MFRNQSVRLHFDVTFITTTLQMTTG